MGLFFGAKQINVVGDEELACASHCGPPGGHKCGRTIVRGPITLFELSRSRIQNIHILLNAELEAYIPKQTGWIID